MTPEARKAIEQSIESHLAQATALIGWLDLMDGDPDGEEGDAEDSFVLSYYAGRDHGPGCPASDPDYGVDDEGEHEDGY